MQGTHQQRGGGSSASARPTSDEPRNRQPPITERQGEEPGYKSQPTCRLHWRRGGKGGVADEYHRRQRPPAGGLPALQSDVSAAARCRGSTLPGWLRLPPAPAGPAAGLATPAAPTARSFGERGLGNADASAVDHGVLHAFDGARRLVGISIAHEALLAAGGDIDVFDVRDRVENSPKLALNRADGAVPLRGVEGANPHTVQLVNADIVVPVDGALGAAIAHAHPAAVVFADGAERRQEPGQLIGGVARWVLPVSSFAGREFAPRLEAATAALLGVFDVIDQGRRGPMGVVLLSRRNLQGVGPASAAPATCCLRRCHYSPVLRCWPAGGGPTLFPARGGVGLGC